MTPLGSLDFLKITGRKVMRVSKPMTICGKCEAEWPTDSGRQVCPACGNDGAIEGHAVRIHDDGKKKAGGLP